MKTITLQDIKKNGSKAIPDNETSYLIVNSIPKTAMVPIDQYESYIEALEELEDLKTVIARAKEDEYDADKVFDEFLK